MPDFVKLKAHVEIMHKILNNDEVKVGESMAVDQILGESWREVADMWAPIHITNEQLECSICQKKSMKLKVECPICGTSKSI